MRVIETQDARLVTRVSLKSGHWILILPLFLFFAVALTLQYGTLAVTFPETDTTPYLIASSVARDFDLAYSRGDSEHYFAEQLVRPSRFRLVRKTIISGDGQYRSYSAFYDPDIYPFILAPFVKFFGYQGILLLHTLLMACLYWIGFRYYAREGSSVLPAVNTVAYYVLVPLPILYLLPSHHLWLFTLMSAALYFGLSGAAALSAVLIGVAFSSSPWAALLGLLLVSYWQTKSGENSYRSHAIKFTVILFITILAVWGVERLMYPDSSISEARWIATPHQKPVAEIWNTLPVVKKLYFGGFSAQQVVDFVFGRCAGFFVYQFAACATLLSAVWLIRDALARIAIVFTLLFLIVVAVSHPTSWNVLNLASDPALLLAALAFFVCPIAKPRTFFVLVASLSCFFVAPLLVNPAGAIMNRPYYLHAFPYRLFPVELSLVGRSGLTADPDFIVSKPNTKLHLLNENFYMEDDFFWVHGEAAVEFLLEQKSPGVVSQFKIQNGPLDNHVSLIIGGLKQEVWLHPGESVRINVMPFHHTGKWMENRFFLHGTIESESGFVPKLLSRDNPDYRFLGCQVHLIVSPATKQIGAGETHSLNGEMGE